MTKASIGSEDMHEAARILLDLPAGLLQALTDSLQMIAFMQYVIILAIITMHTAVKKAQLKCVRQQVLPDRLGTQLPQVASSPQSRSQRACAAGRARPSHSRSLRGLAPLHRLSPAAAAAEPLPDRAPPLPAQDDALRLSQLQAPPRDGDLRMLVSRQVTKIVTERAWM